MILSLEDILGTEITLNEDLFEFTTDDSLVIFEEVEEIDEVAIAEQEVEDMELNAAAELIEAELAEENAWNLNNAAMDIAETPETGASTSVLLILTLMVNGGLLLRKKLLK